MLFSTSYRDAHLQGYRDLEPANFHNIDYSILGTSRVEPLIRRIRNEMLEAGLVVENSKGECNFGQHEINFLYDEVLATADKHAVYKNGAKEIADQEGMAISFMAKYDQREGSSCHVHLSLRDDADAPRLRRRARGVRLVHGRAARDAPGADAPARAEHQLLQALRVRVVRPDGRGVGHRQPHVRAAGARRGEGRSASSCACRAPT